MENNSYDGTLYVVLGKDGKREIIRWQVKNEGAPIWSAKWMAFDVARTSHSLSITSEVASSATFGRIRSERERERKREKSDS